MTASGRSRCFIGSISTAFTVRCKTLNSKITKHEKTTYIVEAKDLTVSRFFSKAIKDGSISDVDFDLILRQIVQYYTSLGEKQTKLTLTLLGSRLKENLIKN